MLLLCFSSVIGFPLEVSLLCCVWSSALMLKFSSGFYSVWVQNFLFVISIPLEVGLLICCVLYICHQHIRWSFFFFLSFVVYWFTLFFFCHQLSAGGEFTLLCLFISLNAGIFSGFCSVWVQNFLFVISFPLTVRLISCVVCVFFFF